MIDLIKISEDMDNLGKEIIGAEKKLVQAETKKELFQKQGEDNGIKNIPHAKKQIEENEQELEKLNKMIEKKYNELKEMYEW